MDLKSVMEILSSEPLEKREILFLAAFKNELDEASEKHPDWPSDPVHASAIFNEEAGELTQACLDFFYDKKQSAGIDKMILEAIQCGAMALRFLIHIDKYRQQKDFIIIKKKKMTPPRYDDVFLEGSAALDRLAETDDWEETYQNWKKENPDET